MTQLVLIYASSPVMLYLKKGRVSTVEGKSKITFSNTFGGLKTVVKEYICVRSSKQEVFLFSVIAHSS